MMSYWTPIICPMQVSIHSLYLLKFQVSELPHIQVKVQFAVSFFDTFSGEFSQVFCQGFVYNFCFILYSCAFHY